ncbi:MAG: hypothetical protein U9O94_08710 [Nanoarchaeota archaeon]|nr:hypothetical protein [Nanoarchaeota archaeon]
MNVDIATLEEKKQKLDDIKIQLGQPLAQDAQEGLVGEAIEIINTM